MTARLLLVALATGCAASPAAPTPPTVADVPPAPATTQAPTTTAAPAVTAAPPSSPTTGAGRAVVGATTTTAAPPEGNEGAATQQAARLACIRHHESGGDYGAVSASGKYRGAHQWDRRTWDGVAARYRPELVGVDPAGASPADQDEMAGHLLDERGLQPWPAPSRRCA